MDMARPSHTWTDTGAHTMHTGTKYGLILNPRPRTLTETGAKTSIESSKSSSTERLGGCGCGGGAAGSGCNSRDGSKLRLGQSFGLSARAKASVGPTLRGTGSEQSFGWAKALGCRLGPKL
eukprot:364959-Chlamydomonas_euryale.AAC.10